MQLKNAAMRLSKLFRAPAIKDQRIGIAPIYKVSFEGEPELIGTGFWVTTRGHFVTAKHVIDDNIGADGVDRGMIYAICMTPDRQFHPRALGRTFRHELFDLALSETLGPDGPEDPDDGDTVVTWPVALTLKELEPGDSVHTHAFVSGNQPFFAGKEPGRTTSEFGATLEIPALNIVYDLNFRTRRESGRVGEVFPEGRDKVMLPFPCFQSEMPLYGANSGGPVFDDKGRVCGVNCSGYEGTDISFHLPIKSVIELRVPNIEFIPEDPTARSRSLAELGLARRVVFQPSAASSFFPIWQRIFMWPIHVYLDVLAHWRWARRREGTRATASDDLPPS